MDKELSKYYDDRFSMMATQGWKDLIEDMTSMYDSYDSVLSVNSVDEYHKRRGQLDILQWFLSLKQMSELAFEDLSNEKDI